MHREHKLPVEAVVGMDRCQPDWKVRQDLRSERWAEDEGKGMADSKDRKGCNSAQEGLVGMHTRRGCRSRVAELEPVRGRKAQQLAKARTRWGI